jgi:hypothetical protein
MAKWTIGAHGGVDSGAGVADNSSQKVDTWSPPPHAGNARGQGGTFSGQLQSDAGKSAIGEQVEEDMGPNNEGWSYPSMRKSRRKVLDQWHSADDFDIDGELRSGDGRYSEGTVGDW